jgi:GTP-binding protein
MRVVEASFIQSGSDDPSSWPIEDMPEIAFIGRSNVGKSTLLQALLQRKGLVRISGTPGRTRLINWFRCVIEHNEKRIELKLVDLPGFGYAKVAKTERESWKPFVQRYLGSRSTLRAAVILVDGRRQPTREEPLFYSETELAQWLSGRGVSVMPIVTKCDQLKKTERKPIHSKIEKAFGMHTWMVSATENEGIEMLWRRLLLVTMPPRD